MVPGAKVLDIGSGSGYLCAAYYEMCKDEKGNANVIGIEHMDELAQYSVVNLNKKYSK